MPRLQEVLSRAAYPGGADAKTSADLAALFRHLFPEGNEGTPHAGYSTLAQTPGVALGVARLSDAINSATIFKDRRDLRELLIQTLNLQFKFDVSFHAHLSQAAARGISLEMQAALPYWRTSRLFDEEQKLIIEYTQACISDHVPEALFARVVERYGERAAIELTIGVGWWVFWGILFNATAPHAEPKAAPVAAR